jgi:hypothetical protein
LTGEPTTPRPGTAGARLVSLDALIGGEIDTWHALRAGNPALDSQYFHPGFAAAVHAGGRPVQWLSCAVSRAPYQRSCPATGRVRGCDRWAGPALTSRDYYLFPY